MRSYGALSQPSFAHSRASSDPEQRCELELLDVVEHGMATSVQFQQTIVRVFLLACAATALLHVALLLALALDPHVSAIRWEASWASPLLLPCLLLALLLPVLLSLRLSTRLWIAGWPQTASSIVLLLATFGLEGAVSGRSQHLARWTSLLWGVLGVLVQCAASSTESRRWWLWVVAYLGVIGAHFHMINTLDGHPFEQIGQNKFPWWREVLNAVNFIVATCLFVVPTGIAARALVVLQSKARALLVSTKKHLELESKLLDALVPAAVTARLLRGDYLVADNFAEGTAMFCYIYEYEDMVLQYGAGPVIDWINRVFSRLDAKVNNVRAITKVETFNHFLLLFSTAPGSHVEDCVRLAVKMLTAANKELRPDGKATMLKIGLSSGPFTTGLIGLQSPRYSIFGDTVNTASRMASSAQPCTIHAPFIHLSPSSRDLLSDATALLMLRSLGRDLVLSEHGPTEIKGKGAMVTHVVSASKPLTPPSATSVVTPLPPAGPPPSV